jgi:hypothetical protein
MVTGTKSRVYWIPRNWLMIYQVKEKGVKKSYLHEDIPEKNSGGCQPSLNWYRK